MFQRLPDDRRPVVALEVDGRRIEAREGDSVAAAMLAAGLLQARSTPVGEAPRGPYCMMGVCFDCLMVIDGVGSRQACLVPVRAGMQVRRQDGAHKP
ncbi:MAG: (2Fe-2S)-binding protein [Reyranellaceae bacterium]